MWWTVAAVLFRKTLLDRIGFFRTDRGSQADEEWEMRAALASDIFFVPQKLATWRVHDKQATAGLAEINRRNLDGLETVLRDPDSGIPPGWKDVSDWERKITRICRTEYLAGYGLYRGQAKANPWKFVRNAWQALRCEPGLLRRQIANGFAWSAEFSPDPLAAARELIDLFGCQWPPTAIEAKGR